MYGLAREHPSFHCHVHQVRLGHHLFLHGDCANRRMDHAGHADAWPGALYLFFYAVVVGFALVRNALAAPYSWLFRPRFLIFAWFLVEIYWWPGSLSWALWIASGILAVKTLTGFLTIRNCI